MFKMSKWNKRKVNIDSLEQFLGQTLLFSAKNSDIFPLKISSTNAVNYRFIELY